MAQPPASSPSATSWAPSREVLGRCTWTLLHAMADTYPRRPTPDQQKKMATFVSLLGEFYPCRMCGDDFTNALKSHPARTDSREELSVWTCEVHNEINRRIGKPEFPCEEIRARLRKETNQEEEGEEGKEACATPYCASGGAKRDLRRFVDTVKSLGGWRK